MGLIRFKPSRLSWVLAILCTVCLLKTYLLQQVNRLEITPDKRFLAAAGNSHIRLFDVNSNSPQPVCYMFSTSNHSWPTCFRSLFNQNKPNRWLAMIHILVMWWLWDSIVMATGCTQVLRTALWESGIYGEVSHFLMLLGYSSFFFPWPAIVLKSSSPISVLILWRIQIKPTSKCQLNVTS